MSTTLRLRLMVSTHPLADDDVPWPGDYRRADKRDIDLVRAWLREKGVGEERYTMEVGAYNCPIILMVKPGRYHVIPLADGSEFA